MFIFIVSAVFPPEPVVSARLSDDIYHSIKELGNNVLVFHPQATRPNGYNFETGLSIGPDEIVSNSYTWPKSSLIGRLRESYSFGKATEAFIRQNHSKIKTIYANTWPLFAQFLLAKTATRYKIPYYVHIQDVYPDSYCHKMPKLLGRIVYKALLPIDKYVLKNSKGVIAISPSMIDYLADSRNVDKSKFTLVRNWQDDNAYIEAYKPIEKKGNLCHIMYLGSINPTANVSLIISACGKLDLSRFKLSIIGNGPEKEKCILLSERLGINANYNTVAPEEVAEVQGTADILVLCLKKGVAKTATPSKLTAYMLSGRPIIASVDLDSDCANIIREAGCGLVVEPDNEDSLSEAIKELSIMSMEDLNKMGKAAFNYAVANLSKQRNLKIITNLITQEN